jgi:hypothetical protein
MGCFFFLPYCGEFSPFIRLSERVISGSGVFGNMAAENNIQTTPRGAAAIFPFLVISACGKTVGVSMGQIQNFCLFVYTIQKCL